MVTSTRFVCSTANSNLVYFLSTKLSFRRDFMQELYDLFFGGFFIEVGADPDILVELPEGAVAMGVDPGDSAGPRCTPPSTPGSPPFPFSPQLSKGREQFFPTSSAPSPQFHSFSVLLLLLVFLFLKRPLLLTPLGPSRLFNRGLQPTELEARRYW